MVFVFLSSSLNPTLYLWRMKDIRNEVTRLEKNLQRQQGGEKMAEVMACPLLCVQY